MILLIATLILGLQDPPPGEVIATAPPPPVPRAQSLPPPRPEQPRSTLDFSGYAASLPPAPVAQPTGFDAAFAQSRSLAPSAPTPLPPEALTDPVRYAAEQCRPGVRPASEDVADCFDRIDRTVREEQDRRAAARRPRVRCENAQSRSDDGRTSSTSGRCSVGTGDPALLDEIMDFD